ncbi:MAG TPA: PH domain-containing protein [Bacillota bacterium]|nr:PH domain-containing protein [Bacillota bacterium]
MQPQTPQSPQQVPYPPQPPQGQQPYPPFAQYQGPPAAPQQPPQEPYQQYAPGSAPPAPKSKDLHPMVVMQPGERIVAKIKRHAFGIVSLYVIAIVGIVLAVSLAIFLLPDMLNQTGTAGTGGSSMSMVYAGTAIVVAGLLLVLGVATSVYWQNEWVVTTDSITQVSQNSLFNREVSQLSMENIEDVTVNQDGILPHMFGFGTLKVESAGERSKFVFPYCPNPNDYARKILEAHEDFLEMRRNIQNIGPAPMMQMQPQQPAPPQTPQA